MTKKIVVLSACLLFLPSFINLEKRWRSQLRRKTTWFSYMSDHLYQLLFVLAAFLLTYAFIKVLVKKRAYKDEGEAEEDTPAE